MGFNLGFKGLKRTVRQVGYLQRLGPFLLGGVHFLYYYFRIEMS